MIDQPNKRAFRRDECDAIIAKLATHYPACFFENPKFRRPLKKDILADLHAAGFPFTREETAAAVEWYKSHFSYRYAVQAGAKRVDLDGREAGTVTLAEQRSAESYIAKRKQERHQDRDLPPPSGRPSRSTELVRSPTTPCARSPPSLWQRTERYRERR
jgi:ProP effector